jgi:uncharacterized protein
MIDPETAQRYYEEHDSAHGFDHVLRVWRLARRIGREEGADMQILQAAVLLHDVGRAEQMRTGACHAAVGARRAREILEGHPRERVERVAQAIAEHRFRGSRGPSSLEARVLYDADKLDAIGAIGVARAYAIAGATGQHLWASVSPEYANRPPTEGEGDLVSGMHTPVHEFRFKLIKLKERMFTSAGQTLAEERHRYMLGFFERLEGEVAGEL